jgi:nitroreductase
MQAWDISDETFPADGSPADQIRFCLRYAVLAPSGHNTQPWLFRIHERTVDLLADRSRGLPVVDPFDRELVISCGAALFNLQLALERFGWELETEVLPEASSPDLLARVALVARREASHEARLLYEEIPRRRTNRGSFDDRPVGEEIVRDLVRCAEREGAWLVALDAASKGVAADLIAQGDRVQFLDTHFRRELTAWTVSNWSRRRDGIPGYALGASDVASAVGPLLVRTFDWAKLGVAAKDRELAEGSPLLVLLGTEHEEPAEWMTAGLALQRVLLAACALGLQCSFLNQPIEVTFLRPRLRELVGRKGFPQLLLRMGYGPSVRPTPRRDLGEVIL